MKKIFCSFLLCVFFYSSSAPAQQKGYATIRKVDFRNFTYGEVCTAGEKNISVKNGIYFKDPPDDPEKIHFVDFEIIKIVYGDITRDGLEDAVIVTFCNTGGTGQFTNGLLYTLDKGQPKFAGELGVGDRANGGLYDVSFENGILLVERFGQENSGACCAEYIWTEQLKWEKGKPASLTPIIKRPLTKEDIDYRHPHSNLTIPIP
ncbi:MAG TPA: hypothetical protein DDW49_01550 [Deltaproteobacteria bacterium]|nr:hypothetical protein [Deltaproteobacteria bacterium]